MNLELTRLRRRWRLQQRALQVKAQRQVTRVVCAVDRDQLLVRNGEQEPFANGVATKRHHLRHQGTDSVHGLIQPNEALHQHRGGGRCVVKPRRVRLDTEVEPVHTHTREQTHLTEVQEDRASSERQSGCFEHLGILPAT